jgi:hypothetical protein
LLEFGLNAENIGEPSRAVYTHRRSHRRSVSSRHTQSPFGPLRKM